MLFLRIQIYVLFLIQRNISTNIFLKKHHDKFVQAKYPAILENICSPSPSSVVWTSGSDTKNAHPIGQALRGDIEKIMR